MFVLGEFGDGGFCFSVIDSVSDCFLFPVCVEDFLCWKFVAEDDESWNQHVFLLLIVFGQGVNGCLS